MNERYGGDTGKVYDFYNSNYEKYGYSVKSLAWIKGKQNIRFDALTKFWDLSRPFSILDIGCGFGDLNKFFALKGISEYTYRGIDLVEGMISTAKEIYKDRDNLVFETGDFVSDFPEEKKYDFVLASGIFNFQMNEGGNYENIESILKKALAVCNDRGSVSFDFQSDKVDFFSENGVSFYNSPEKVLSIAYKHSRNVILNNLYMPFEFSMTIFKDDTFEKSNLVFSKFISENEKEFKEGIFHEG